MTLKITENEEFNYWNDEIYYTYYRDEMGWIQQYNTRLDDMDVDRCGGDFISKLDEFDEMIVNSLNRGA